MPRTMNFPWRHGRSLVKQTVEEDIREELQAHLALAVDEGMREGLSEEQARTVALARFGDFEETVRGCKRMKLGGMEMARHLSWALVIVLVVALFMSVMYGRAREAQARAALHEALAVMAYERQEQALVEDDGLTVQPLIVHIGDQLQIVESNHGALNRLELVAIDGTILLPEIGHVSVVGLTRPEAEELLRAAYAPYYEELNLFVRLHQPERN